MSDLPIYSDFFNHYFSKFILLLRKSVFRYEYMDNWKKFTKTLLPEKEDFYSNFNMENITDADYACRKRVLKYFKIKSL